MEHKDLVEILAAHADQLNSGVSGDTEYLQIPSEQRQELLSLLRLAEQVKSVLAPVQPSPSYKQRLRHHLIEVARQRMSRELLIAPSSSRRELVIGAAIGSAVALAGGIAYLIRTHIQSRSQHAGQIQP